MNLPQLNNPETYVGLYIFDFGNDQVAVGYTAEEIAVLLEPEQYRGGKVYRIHRALPDGTIELEGVSRRRFELEDGLFFYASGIETARRDFETLNRVVDRSAPPCRMKAHLAELTGASYPYCLAILFPAEYTRAVADWLLVVEFGGGEFVEGGPSQVTAYYEASPRIVDRRQYWSTPTKDSRPAEEVLATTHLAIQRVPA